MKLLKIYQNFYLRNLIVFIFFIVLIFSSVYNDFYNEPKNMPHSSLWLLVKIFVATLPLYILMLFSNVLFVKGLFLEKKYFLFICTAVAYWIGAHFFLVWYYMYYGITQYKLLSSVLAFTNGSAMYFLHIWILKNIAEGRKELINAESELSFLKQQLNPHFLLNAMNNLYGESLSAPENLSDRILNLSDMLRYQIEATKKNLVPLHEEVEFIKRYIEYYAFRNNRLQVEQQFRDISDDIRIPPLFLLPLVENAIKFSGETEKPAISLTLSVGCNQLTFAIQNNFLIEGSRLDGTGIGIENLQRRLEVYGLNHELVYGKKKDLFNAKLKIWGLSTVA